GEPTVARQLVTEVSWGYAVRVKVSLLGKTTAADAQLHEIEFETTTMLNGKAQPKLALGRNTIYVGAGDQTESIVFWPDLQGTNYQACVVEEKNISTRGQHPGFLGVLHAAKPSEEAYVV